MKDYDLQRFISAQEYDYTQALSEIKSGRKTSHWIWYIFPQLKGLGRSYNSEYYGIDGIGEAEQYINHPVLGARLREITNALLMLKNSDPAGVMGHIDALKLRSCMTLFAQFCGDNSVFHKVLDKFFNGERDTKTLELLGKKQQ